MAGHSLKELMLFSLLACMCNFALHVVFVDAIGVSEHNCIGC